MKEKITQQAAQLSLIFAACLVSTDGDLLPIIKLIIKQILGIYDISEIWTL